MASASRSSRLLKWPRQLAMSPTSIVHVSVSTRDGRAEICGDLFGVCESRRSQPVSKLHGFDEIHGAADHEAQVRDRLEVARQRGRKTCADLLQEMIDIRSSVLAIWKFFAALDQGQSENGNVSRSRARRCEDVSAGRRSACSSSGCCPESGGRCCSSISWRATASRSWRSVRSARDEARPCAGLHRLRQVICRRLRH